MMLLLTAAAFAPSFLRAEVVISEEGLTSVRSSLKHKLEMLGGEQTWSDTASKTILEQALTNAGNERDEMDWLENHEDFVKEDGITYTRSEYFTPRFGIESGGEVFTWNPFYHLKFPKGDYVLTKTQWDIVDGSGSNAIPLTELYNHHWLVGTHNPVGFDPLGFGPIGGMCEDDLFWGGGAEYRNLDYSFPAGYGIQRIGASGVCGANLHFIRVDDLKTSWEGFNDPQGNHGAALKNCAECGYAPGRSPYCLEWLDGFWPCCILGARCPVNNPKDRTKKTYRMKYTVEWTRSMSSFKNLRVHCFDLGGATRVEKQNFLFGTEWNAGPYLNNEGAHQRCNGTVCNITQTVVVGKQKSLENGICAGEMIWSYMHMHSGGLSGSMYINSKLYCTSLPVVGTDASNPPGNEKGFMVNITNCVNENTLGNKVRLNKGDVVTVTALYDVDPASTRNLPLPGGKRGGVMALFFSAMHCDADTWGEHYVCRENTCIGVKKLTPLERTWNTHGDCEKACGASLKDIPTPALSAKGLRGSNGPSPSPDPDSERESTQTTLPHSEVNASLAPVGVEGLGGLQVTWRDCGGTTALATIDHFAPSTMPLRGTTKLTGSGTLPKDIRGGNFTMKLEAGVFGITLIDISGDICEGKKASTLLGMMHAAWDGVNCPVAAGKQDVAVSITISALIPLLAAQTTTTVVATSSEGELMFCMEVITTGKGKSNELDFAV